MTQPVSPYQFEFTIPLALSALQTSFQLMQCEVMLTFLNQKTFTQNGSEYCIYLNTLKFAM